MFEIGEHVVHVASGDECQIIERYEACDGAGIFVQCYVVRFRVGYGPEPVPEDAEEIEAGWYEVECEENELAGELQP